MACGFGHVVACSESGKIYSWGLNCKGQLGVNDIKSRRVPEPISTIENVSKIFAFQNCSSCIDVNGKLYTWGCGTGFRLMHEADDSNKLLPTLVEQLSSVVVDSFACSLNESCALVKTCVVRVREMTSSINLF